MEIDCVHINTNLLYLMDFLSVSHIAWQHDGIFI